jgi:hypothetical protein
VVFALGAGAHTFIVSKLAFGSFPTATATISGATTVTIAGSPIGVPAPAAEPAMCTFYEYLRHQNGAAAAGATVKLKIVALPYDYTGALFSGAEVQVAADAQGLVSWTVPRGATVLVSTTSIDFGITRKASRVPDAGSASLSANWVPELTSDEIAALTPTPGTVVYSKSAGRLRVYEAGHWTDLRA